MMIRSGRMRRLLTNNCLCRTAPTPSTFGGLVSSRTTFSCCICNSAASSMVTRRSVGGIYFESMFRKVVLPAPVPPEIRMLILARTAADRIASISLEMLLFSTNFSAVSGVVPKRRIETAGPSRASGGMMAFTRDPSASRASTMGDDSSTRRPTAPTIRSMICNKCRSSRNLTSTFCSLPKRSTKTMSLPFTRMSEMVGSASSASSGPRPNTSSSSSA